MPRCSPQIWGSHRWGFSEWLNVGCVMLRLRMPLTSLGATHPNARPHGWNIRNRRDSVFCGWYLLPVSLQLCWLPLVCHELSLFCNVPCLGASQQQTKVSTNSDPKHTFPSFTLGVPLTRKVTKTPNKTEFIHSFIDSLSLRVITLFLTQS